MDILVRLANGNGDPVALRIRATHDATVGDLADHLAGWVGEAPGSTIEGLQRDDLIRDVGPRSGSLIHLTRLATDRPDEQMAPVRLLSTVTRGRPSNGEVSLRYGTNSLECMDLHVSNVIELLPRPETRVFVNGDRVIGSRRVCDGDLISITGREEFPLTPDTHFHQMTSAFAIEVAGTLAPPERGPFSFHRPASRLHDEYLAPTITSASAPETSRLPGLPVLSAVVPLLFGAVLWATTRSIASAVFVLFSFFYIAVAGIESRREFRKDIQHREAEFKTATARSIDRIHDANRDEAAFINRTNPDHATLRDLLRTRSPRVWERGPDDTTGGFLSVRLGTAVRAGRVRVEGPSGGRSDLVRWFEQRLSSVRHTELPVTIDLSKGGGLGLVGGDESLMDLARWILLQLVTLVGPDLLQVIVLTSQHRRDSWSWTSWLPHVNGVSDPAWTLIVVDGADEEDTARSLEGRDRERTCFIWLAPRPCDLPRLIGQSVVMGDPPSLVRARGTDPESFGQVELEDLSCDGATHEAALEAAILLAPLVPQRILESHGTADRSDVTLGGIVRAVKLDDPESILRAWHDPVTGPRLSAPLARSGSGTMEIDLVSDGPHALVAGMTGAGKSELLRTWLTSLALHHPPDRITFLLVDYKGGSAFGPLSRLPHAVGLITDLDTELADRAMVSLRAELRARESWLSEVGAGSMVEAEGRTGRPPALIVVVDEFATLAKELPGMVDELVDVAQRGRSLGIHLVLATQRPHGVVSESIRANTSIRIALRVADTSDSTDVIDAPDAVSLARTSPGSAIVRIGQARSGTVRFAYSSGPFTARARISSRPVSSTDRAETAVDHGSMTEIDVATASIIAAFEASGSDLPPRPWVAPLTATLTLASLECAPSEHRVTIGLVDRPEHQKIVPLSLDLDDGPGVVVFGTSGRGRSNILSTIAAATAHTFTSPLIYSIGRRIDHATDSIATQDTELVMRVLRQALVRAHDPQVGPRTMILIDDIAMFEKEYETLNRGEALNILESICRRGTNSGVNVVVGASRRMDLPAALAVGFNHRLVMGLASEDEASLLGVPTAIAGDVPEGRGIYDGHWIQIADEQGCERCSVVEHRPVVRLADRIDLTKVLVGATEPTREHPTSTWVVPVGLCTDDLEPVFLDLTHSHGLVVGPRRSGRSTTLRTIADGWMHSQEEADRTMTVLIGPDASRTIENGCRTWQVVISATAGRLGGVEPSVIESALWRVVDGVDHGHDVLIAVEELPTLLDGPCAEVLERFMTHVLDPSTGDTTRLVVSGEIDAISRCYSPALTTIRAGRTGILLRPDEAIHGSILGCDLGRRDELVIGPGRGWLVDDGHATPIQVAVADPG